MNILTFDLDFLFPKMDEINDDLFDSSGIEFLNQQALNLLNQILNSNIYKKIKIIESHDDILKYINFKKIKNIYNIDNHHDIYYSDEQKSAIENKEFEKLDKEDKEACWFYYLFYNNNKIKYNWIGHQTSELVNSTLKYGFKFFLEEGSTLNPFFILEELLNKNFDTIYICLSPNYISKIQQEYCLQIIKESRNTNDNK